ncbi:DUF4112 domain-containing protein [Fodinibius halophilus]|uniref:DUF4112 domain-containing protein n=1 Tax=Fodinibius halophilus TaxID=1736908 RepID=A0A6M1TCK7_9BACT|nr:DUF4112 domain-containing protein [Fodinibius halophilus]NGP90103.1 DUF4112 domain-containing protein [Fodinibius halophilus]
MNNKKDKKKVTKLAELLDNKFQVPGIPIKFGLDPLLGLLPGVGDWIGGVISCYYLFNATKEQARWSVLLRILINILLDVLIGAIPGLGEVFDVYWKANIRNAEILQELADHPEQTTRRSRWFNWIIFIGLTLIIFAVLFATSWILIASWVMISDMFN